MLIPPLPTPFSSDGTLALDKIAALVETLHPHVDGFLVLGSTGEAIAQSEYERERVIQETRQHCLTKLLLVGTGGENTQLVIERNQRAADLGADRVLILPPHYYKGLMHDEVLNKHYQHVAEHCPVPVLLYNIPQITGIALSPTLIAQLAKHPNIVGLKDSSGNVGNLAEVLRQVPADFDVFTGHAPTLLPALSLGARGGILAVANLWPDAYKQLIRAVHMTDMAKAQDIQLSTNPLALTIARYGIPGLKAALRLLGSDAGVARAPLPRLNREGQQNIAAVLAQLAASSVVPGSSLTMSSVAFGSSLTIS